MNALTQQHKELLERQHDGDLSEFEAKQAEKLLASSSVAREFLASLEEIGDATRVAEEEVWSQADPPAAALVAEAATQAHDDTLDQLAPLLERFFDGETSETESEFVAELVDTRDDVANYLSELDGLRASVLGSNEIIGDVDFGGFWDGIAARLDESNIAFDTEEHTVLLYRFHDNEATEDEIATVNAWVEAGVPDVVDTLEALREVQFMATVSVETAQEGVDFSSIWSAVEEAMDQDLEAQGENIVAFGRAKRDSDAKKQPVLQRYQQSIYGAVAAIFLGVLVLGVFNDQLFGPQQVIVEKTIVIVDSVEYAPGSSVMINSPAEQASAVQTADSDIEADPTVIWILDTGEESLPEEGEDEKPKEGQDAESDYGQPI